MVLTRRRALAAGGLLLTGLSGCSSRDDATETATVGEQSYAGTVDDPTSRTVRNASGEPAVRSTVVDPFPEWTDTHWLVTDSNDREALYFADDAERVDAARSVVEKTDFSAELVLVHQRPVRHCEEWSLERLQWGAADAGAPAGSADVDLSYETVEQEGDCEADDGRDVAATFIRIPARFERVTEFGFGVS
ncbi:hypothetical protein JCM30237_10450 [Halolamina litorea]|uniref:Uncharacterized protein n=1 Tax=Halolamina litorea TaxID=1515593 RepID=A0ABD6BUQ5_9EURY|nr:hypothetical protein [Halolamina litorea]